MQVPSQRHVHNGLLAALSPDDYTAIQPALEPVVLKRKDVLIQPRRPISHVYFIESGVASVIVGVPDAKRIEVGIVGREGIVGTSLLLDVDSIPHETFIQIEGQALRIERAAFTGLVEDRSALRRTLLRYAHIFHLHTAQTALSNGSYTLEERLARWLLMCHDRVDGNEFPITHEFLSVMLGVHRPGVTTTIHVLEGEGMIRARRSHMEILDREKLRIVAGGSYGIPEAEYHRLITNDGRAMSER